MENGAKWRNDLLERPTAMMRCPRLRALVHALVRGSHVEDGYTNYCSPSRRIYNCYSARCIGSCRDSWRNILERMAARCA
ncbi:Hypothetical predicted protein [Olea europaea subsp. europaea]|uniref:Uncharacterized protein n=1 Tax=Olea europaea subsp. europaea TaxID=158383 RepID=A0A8S0P8Q8_OLEEU|nr:Hypothetical predicted protein [Olea europaea subsp. europaea]